MRGEDFRRRIVQAVDLVHHNLKLTRTVSSTLSLPVNRDFNEVALNMESTYSQIYRAAVSLSQYNVMLNDYAVFQFSWDSETSWRLAYLPNPWLSGVDVAQKTVSDWETLESLGELDNEEVTSLLDELPYYGSIPPLRFEYSVAQYREISHPAAHLHIGRHTDNRWALSRPLDPLTFIMIVLRLYYPAEWNPLSSFHGGREEECLDRRLATELGRIHLVHEFSEIERRSLHFASQ
ncbi:DUF2290 domain-containing protein [Sphingomonas sp. LB3N6]|uniref:DUF2290 domain-containing protein n=1 Tax=Sphingomonas fucosidasi TaxID=3096164 RepID=UPI002FC5AD22